MTDIRTYLQRMQQADGRTDGRNRFARTDAGSRNGTDAFSRSSVMRLLEILYMFAKTDVRVPSGAKDGLQVGTQGAYESNLAS